MMHRRWTRRCRTTLGRPVGVGAALLITLALVVVSATAGEEKVARPDDPEAAVHQLLYEKQVGDIVLRQYEVRCLAHLSYLLGSGGEAVVVDPMRDVDTYVRDAAQLGFTITKVVLTHVPGDYVAGHTELQRRVGAEILLRIPADSGDPPPGFEHRPVLDGDQVKLGDATLEFLTTPGTTIDALTVLVRLAQDNGEPNPLYAFTGDSLLVGGIGRIDTPGNGLLPAALADMAFDSIQRLRMLPDDTKVLPAHGAGTLCAGPLDPYTVSRVGRERSANPYMRTDRRAAFVASALANYRRPPHYFRSVATLNRAGPPTIGETPELPPALAPKAVAAADAAGVHVIDVRPPHAFSAGHIDGALGIPVRGPLETWIARSVPLNDGLVFVGSIDEIRESMLRLRRIGLCTDHVRGRLEGGMEAWTEAGFAARESGLMSPADLARRIEACVEPIVIDVRPPRAHAKRHIAGSLNMPLDRLEQLKGLVLPTRPLLLICRIGVGSSIGVGLLERAGFAHVESLDGGMEAWTAAGLPTVDSATKGR